LNIFEVPDPAGNPNTVFLIISNGPIKGFSLFHILH
jgi:hypothetical protein